MKDGDYPSDVEEESKVAVHRSIQKTRSHVHGGKVGDTTVDVSIDKSGITVSLKILESDDSETIVKELSSWKCQDWPPS